MLSSKNNLCLSFQQGRGKRRIKLVLDREYETSSTGEDTLPGTQPTRAAPTANSHANVNGGVYVAQNGSIIRTRRSVNATNTQSTNNNLKLPVSPVFSSRLAKHFKKLDKMAATLEERIPLGAPRTAVDGGCTILRTFQSSGKASTLATPSFSNTDQTLNVLNTRNSSVSLVSTCTSNAGHDAAANKSNLLKAVQGPQPQTQQEGEGERESQVDGRNTSDEGGLLMREPLDCPSDRTQTDEEELWMGPWNNLHIPMTKL
uniref:Uncharacterized protein n=1 Tax=Knipowitschia caucasica TaxID=637954 RepID=A0AAV2LG85_KNICA